MFLFPCRARFGEESSLSLAPLSGNKLTAVVDEECKWWKDDVTAPQIALARGAPEAPTAKYLGTDVISVRVVKR